MDGQGYTRLMISSDMERARSCDLQLPTELQRTAWNLRRQQGLTDAQVAEVMGISREHACRLRAGCRRRVNAIRRFAAERGIATTLLDAIMAENGLDIRTMAMSG